jgi:F-type H+-transporting ATPase subunit epsilon
MTLKLEIVTQERYIYSDDVDFVIAPGVEGELGILPNHCPLITMLQPGELKIIKKDEEILIAIGGGFLEVRPDRIIILADVADRDDEIDMQKVEEAIRRAEQLLSNREISAVDKTELETSLRLELARLNIAEKRKKKHRGLIDKQ